MVPMPESPVTSDALSERATGEAGENLQIPTPSATSMSREEEMSPALQCDSSDTGAAGSVGGSGHGGSPIRLAAEEADAAEQADSVEVPPADPEPPGQVTAKEADVEGTTKDAAEPEPSPSGDAVEDGTRSLADDVSSSLAAPLPADRYKANEELVPLLLQFLKEYHMRDEDKVTRQMLQDICAAGSHPRPLGHWGIISAATVRQAIAAFELWKEHEGCPGMPVHYNSKSMNREYDAIVSKKNNDGSVDVGNIDVQTNQYKSIKQKAPMKQVRRRRQDGWFVPPIGGLQEPATGSAVAADAAAGECVPPASRCKVLHAFDGRTYGAEYLVLNPGDVVECRPVEESSQGWSYGQVLERAGPCVCEVMEGWYPAEYAASM